MLSLLGWGVLWYRKKHHALDSKKQKKQGQKQEQGQRQKLEQKESNMPLSDEDDKSLATPNVPELQHTGNETRTQEWAFPEVPIFAEERRG
jgi:hypothetical protein